MSASDGSKTMSVSGFQGALNVVVDREQGKGVPLVFLHADLGRLQQWDEVITRALAAGMRNPIARLDFRGHGDSAPANNDDYSYPGRAEDVLAVLDRLEWTPVVLVAHSGANGATLELAAEDPDRVAGILMVDPPTDPLALPEEVREQMMKGLSGPDSLEYLRGYYRSIAGDDTAVVERVLADTESTTPESRLGVGQALMQWTPAPLDRYPGAVFVIGTDVTDGPAALWSQRPAVDHTVIHGTGHWVHIEEPDAVLEALFQLLERVG